MTLTQAEKRPQPSSDANRYIPELDGLRAISILMVMMGHAGLKIVSPVLGVIVFFVVSGYLICNILLAEWRSDGRISLKLFYARRALRLYPELVVYVLVLLGVCMLLSWTFSWVQIAGALFYFTNYLQIFGNEQTSISYITRPLWSLAVEEHFYLIFPVFVIAMRGKADRMAAALATVMVAASLWRVIALQIWTPPHYYMEYATEVRIDAIAAGCLFACLLAGSARERVAGLLARHGYVVLALALVMLVVSLGIRSPAFRDTWRITLQVLGSALLLAAVVHGGGLGWARQLLALPPMIYLGRLSYAAYLYHLLVYELLQPVLPITSHAFAPVAMALSFAAASLSYHLVDMRVRPLRRKLGSHVSKEAVPAG